MAIQTTRWDSAEHLKTEEDVQLYLEACLEKAVAQQNIFYFRNGQILNFLP